MFDLAEVGNVLLDTVVSTIILDDIHKEYDLSSDKRSRKIKIDGSIDLKRATVEFNLNFRSEPKVTIPEGVTVISF